MTESLYYHISEHNFDRIIYLLYKIDGYDSIKDEIEKILNDSLYIEGGGL